MIVASKHARESMDPEELAVLGIESSAGHMVHVPQHILNNGSAHLVPMILNAVDDQYESILVCKYCQERVDLGSDVVVCVSDSDMRSDSRVGVNVTNLGELK